MGAHLPALQVVVPLLAAPLCVLLRRGGLAWALTTLVSWFALAVSALLLDQALADGTISYHLGGWAPPWGIEYRIDPLNAFVLLIVAGIGAVLAPYAKTSVEREIPSDRQNLFYAAWLLCLTGLLGITITGDAFNIFVFLEISSLSSYALIAMGRERQALTAAYRYLVLGTIGATFILIGIGLIYMMTGTLNIADMTERVEAVQDTRPIRAAVGFLTVGIALKLALFPLHLWLPNAYTFAPSAVSAFLAATATKVSAYVLLRFMFTVFGHDFSLGVLPLNQILVTLAVVAFLVGSTVAIFQGNAKRLLAYSSVAQIGYIVLGIGLVGVSGLTAGIIHMFNHAITKGAMFLALGCIFYRIGSYRIEDMAGIGRRMPWTMFAFVLGGLSLIGVPLTAGFISKWYLIIAALEHGGWGIFLAGLVLVSSLLAVIYIWRVVEIAYFREPGDKVAEASEAPLSLLVPTWILTGATLYFGVLTDLPVGAATAAAQALMGAAQ